MNEWISIKERLPVNAGVYLVYWRYPDAEKGHGSIGFADFDAYGGDDTLVWEDDSICDLYTHWMPLPTQPENAVDTDLLL